MVNVYTPLRLLRKEKGFSQQELAGVLGITQTAYSLMERYPYRAPYARVKEIQKILDIPDDLLDAIFIPNSNTTVTITATPK